MRREWKLSRRPLWETDDRNLQKNRAATTDWDGDRQGATNDSNEYDPHLTIKDGYPVIYTCEEAVPPNATIQLVDFQFDYEVTFSIQKNYTFTENLRALEWSTLWYLVRKAGLDKCNLQDQQIPQSRKMLSLEDRRILNGQDPTSVVMLGSEPSDVIDQETGACTFSSFNHQTEYCVPMQGVMTAMYTGNVERVKTYLLSQTEAVFNNPTVLVNDISQVEYVGDRSLPTPSLDPSDDADASKLGLIVGASAGAFFILVLLYLFFSNARKNRRSEKELDTLERAKTDLESLESSQPVPVAIVSVRRTTPQPPAGTKQPTQPVSQPSSASAPPTNPHPPATRQQFKTVVTVRCTTPQPPAATKQQFNTVSQPASASAPSTSPGPISGRAVSVPRQTNTQHTDPPLQELSGAALAPYQAYLKNAPPPPPPPPRTHRPPLKIDTGEALVVDVDTGETLVVDRSALPAPTHQTGPRRQQRTTIKIEPMVKTRIPSKRRKKKNKKRRRRNKPLVLVNGMDTIQEVDEEEYDENDSEYESSDGASQSSTDDEDRASYRRSSSSFTSPPLTPMTEVSLEDQENTKPKIPRLPPPWV